MVTEPRELRTFETCKGTRIYQIPLEVFPAFWGFAYLVMVEGFRVLIDTGSGFGKSNQHLEEGLGKVSSSIGRELTLKDLTHVFITHGHIDHFGGLDYVRPRTQAKIGVHELDRRNLTKYEERISIVTIRLKHFLAEAGVSEERSKRLLDLYQINKSLFRSVSIDFTFGSSGMQVGPFKMLHVPGHCAGHVVIRLDDVLFSGDHILSGISPHQAPERLTTNTGLGHYLASLDVLKAWMPEARLTLCGHEASITNLVERIENIKMLHRGRLQSVLDVCLQPKTVAEIADVLFGDAHGYHELLALEEAGAHLEYLYQRGLVEVSNLDELGNGARPVALRYQRLTHPIDVRLI
ncbi:MAG: MBL fold metallo-hydrolase [Chloroflexota bacterium]